MASSQIGPVDGDLVPLPAAEPVHADVQRMVDFGPRPTGPTYPLKVTDNGAMDQDGGAEEKREYRDPSATVRT